MSLRNCSTCRYGVPVRCQRADWSVCFALPEGRYPGWTPRDAGLPAEPDEGRKDDTGKDPWGLLPFDAIRAIVKVLAFGAQKYSARNWEKGMGWHRPFDACLRHLTAWWGGEKADPETGFSHLWHAGACILFLVAYEIRGVGKDDRPKLSD